MNEPSLILQIPLTLTLTVPETLPLDALEFCEDRFELLPELHGCPYDGWSGFQRAFERAIACRTSDPNDKWALTPILRHCANPDQPMSDMRRLSILVEEGACLAHPCLIWALLQQPGQFALRLCHALFGVVRISGLQALLRKTNPGANERGLSYGFSAHKSLDDGRWRHQIQPLLVLQAALSAPCRGKAERRKKGEGWMVSLEARFPRFSGPRHGYPPSLGPFYFIRVF